MYDIIVLNIVPSKLIETKINSKYSIGFLGEVMRPLYKILAIMIG